MRQNLIGIVNGDIRLFLLLSQALWQAHYTVEQQFQILKHFVDPGGLSLQT